MPFIPPSPGRGPVRPRQRLAVLLFALLVLAVPFVRPASAAPTLPAFPGAEGHGALTVGGRGGAVLEVTNLNAAGPGSLRAAVEAKGPRTIVFRVGGTIRQTDILNIREPFVTIAGQTAPGGGITIRGPGLAVMTHDVIVRGLRIRVGDDPGVSYRQGDGLRVDGGWNVIVDHCSLSWADDENLSTSTYSGDTYNVTFQWNIVSEGLWHGKHPEGPHSMGLLISEHSQRISVHHNLLAHNNQRNPQIKGDTDVEFVNNVVYDWGQIATEFVDSEKYGPASANIIGNYYKPGPGTVSAPPVKVRTGITPYLAGNIGVADSGAPLAEASTLSAESAQSAYEAVLAQAGALAPQRDAIDARVVEEVRQTRGRIIDSPLEVGGYLDVASGDAPADGDHDGMPDSWETAQGLNPANGADRNSLASSGYTMLEEYLNSLIVMPTSAAVERPFRVSLPLVGRR